MKVKNLLLAAACAACACACGTVSQTRQMESADNFTVSCEPSVLELRAGKIEAEFSIDFPKGYFAPSAVMVVTPVLVYEGSQRTGSAIIYQGSAVQANYKEIPLKGKVVREKVSFDYLPGMQQCSLELRPIVAFGQKSVTLPALKVAEGCRTLCLLADTEGVYDLKEADYQDTVRRSTEIELRYQVNSSEVGAGSGNSMIVRDAKEYVQEIEADPRSKVTGAHIVGYASPEGGEERNANLSQDRAESARAVWKGIFGSEAGLDLRSAGQDWEGLRASIEASDIYDKNLILRVLDMYTDPSVRESEMRNMSKLYSDLKAAIFPELRRSSIIVESEFCNYTLEELRARAREELFMMTEDELIHLANNLSDRDTRSFYYRLAAERFGSAAGYYNLAMLALGVKIDAVASSYLGRVQEDADVLNARGVIAMRAGKYDDALALFEKSGNRSAHLNSGTIYIMKGEYEAAAAALAGTGSFNEALALVLCGRADEVRLQGSDAREAYLLAVMAARKGDSAQASKWLEKACADVDFKASAAKDIEFSALR